MAQPTWKDIEEGMECRFGNGKLELWGTEQEVAIRVKDGFLKVATTQQADLDVWMVLLNVLRDEAGGKLITLQATAEGFGYKHRQDVDNRMQRYRAAGNSITGVLAPWIERPWVLTPEVKTAIEELGVRDLRATGEEIRDALVARGVVESKEKISLGTIYDALGQADFNKLRVRLRGELEDGAVQYREAHLLRGLFELVQTQQELLEQNGIPEPASVLSVEELRAMLPSHTSDAAAQEPPAAQNAFGYPLTEDDLQAFLFDSPGERSTPDSVRCPDCDTAETTKKSSQETTLQCGTVAREVHVEKRRCSNDACSREAFTVSADAKTFWLETSVTVLLLYKYCRASFGRIARFYGFGKRRAYQLFCTFGRASVHAMLLAHGPRLQYSGVLVIDEKWVKIPKHFKAKGSTRKFAFAYMAVDPHTMDLVHCELFENNDYHCTKLFLLQLRSLGYRPLAIVTDGLQAYGTAIPQVFSGTTHHLCIWHHLHNLEDTLRDLFGKEYRGIPEVADLRKSIGRIFGCKDKRTARRRFEEVMARRSEFVAFRAECAKVFEALERDFPKLVNAIGSPHIPRTTNAAELVIRQFAMHYQTMAGFETLEGARLQLRLFALVYRFTPFTEKARPSWRGKCPLEIAGYEVQDLPLYKMLRTPLATNIIELAVGRQDSLPLEASV